MAFLVYKLASFAAQPTRAKLPATRPQRPSSTVRATPTVAMVVDNQRSVLTVPAAGSLLAASQRGVSGHSLVFSTCKPAQQRLGCPDRLARGTPQRAHLVTRPRGAAGPLGDEGAPSFLLRNHMRWEKLTVRLFMEAVSTVGPAIIALALTAATNTAAAPHELAKPATTQLEGALKAAENASPSIAVTGGGGTVTGSAPALSAAEVDAQAEAVAQTEKEESPMAKSMRKVVRDKLQAENLTVRERELVRWYSNAACTVRVHRPQGGRRSDCFCMVQARTAR
jgi:hypothetical protein